MTIGRGASRDAVHWLTFDGQCPICRRSVRLVRRLDWQGQIRSLDLHTQAEEISVRAAHLTHADLMEAMRLITPAGEVFAGFFALRRTARLLPLLWPLLPLLYLPGMSSLGPALYRCVARARYRISRCSPDDSCRR